MRLGDVHLAAEACAVGLVLPVALSEGQPFGVCVTECADYEMGDDGLAYVSND